ncbi:uncharacterized protein BDZ99DRAFT_398357, partial [Mytilinidion resinicola]
PITNDDLLAHETSMLHIMSRPLQPPPSHIDRTRKGLSYLEAYSYNPDSQTRLGGKGEGILHPIKAKEKRDTVGLGMKLKSSKNGKAHVPKRPINLDANKIRKMHNEDTKKQKKL